MFDFLGPFIKANWFGAVSFFIVGVVILSLGAQLVISRMAPVARFFRIKEFVVVILGVSVFSSFPELTVSLMANLKGHSDISIGNVIGSNFVTLTFVTGLCAMIAPFKVIGETKERESAWMILSSILTLILAMDGKLSRTDGLIMVSAYVPYIYSVVRNIKREAADAGGGATEARSRLIRDIALLLVGIIAIIGGAQVTLDAGQNLGERSGIPPLVMGILIFAFGTSLPELAISLTATIRKKTDVTISEIYASNIFTALVVMGTCAIARPLDVSQNVVRFDIPFLILAASVIQIFITTGSRLVRLEALLILLLYAYFVMGHFFPLPFFC